MPSLLSGFLCFSPRQRATKEAVHADCSKSKNKCATQCPCPQCPAAHIRKSGCGLPDSPQQQHPCCKCASSISSVLSTEQSSLNSAVPCKPPPVTEWLHNTFAGEGLPEVTALDLANRLDGRDPVVICKMRALNASTLEPVFVASSLRALLYTNTPQDYQAFLVAAQQADVRLQQLIQLLSKHINCLSGAAVCTCFEDSSQPTLRLPSTLDVQGMPFSLQLVISPLLIKPTKHSQTREPALMIEHIPSGHQNVLAYHLGYSFMMLDRSETILTVCDLKGKVLRQNWASISYAGSWVPPLMPTSGTSASKAYNGDGLSYLRQLFRLQPELLEELLEDVTLDRDWQTIARVPQSLQAGAELGSRETLKSVSVRQRSMPNMSTTHTFSSKAATLQSKASAPAITHRSSVDSNHGARLSTHDAGWMWGRESAGRTHNSMHSSHRYSIRSQFRASDTADDPVCETLPYDVTTYAAGHRTSSAANLNSLITGSTAAQRLQSFTSLAGLSQGQCGSQHSQSRKAPVLTSRLQTLLLPATSVATGVSAGSASPTSSAPLCQTRSFRNGSLDSATIFGTSPRSDALPTALQTRGSLSQSPVCAVAQRNSAGIVFVQDASGMPASTNSIDKYWPCDEGQLATQADVMQQAQAQAEQVPIDLPSLNTGNTPTLMNTSNTNYCWHDVSVSKATDPVTGEPVLIVMQTDVTQRFESEQEWKKASDACVRVLELIFPRHVIEHLTFTLSPNMSQEQTQELPPSHHAAQPTALPEPVNHRLEQVATKHASVTLFFCDIVGFTNMSKEVEPVKVMRFLNVLYTEYDLLADKHGVYKVETVGDCYVVAGGLMSQDEQGFAIVNTDNKDASTHALAVYRFAQEVLQVANSMPDPHTGQPVKVRIGIHTGPVTSGVVGYRMPKFCLFGDTMNTASRMETYCAPNCIQLSEDTYKLLQESPGATQDLVCTGGVEIKGKGKLVTYMYKPPAWTNPMSMVGRTQAGTPTQDGPRSYSSTDYMYQMPPWSPTLPSGSNVRTPFKSTPCGPEASQVGDNIRRRSSMDQPVRAGHKVRRASMVDIVFAITSQSSMGRRSPGHTSETLIETGSVDRILEGCKHGTQPTRQQKPESHEQLEKACAVQPNPLWKDPLFVPVRPCSAKSGINGAKQSTSGKHVAISLPGQLSTATEDDIAEPSIDALPTTSRRSQSLSGAASQVHKSSEQVAATGGIFTLLSVVQRATSQVRKSHSFSRRSRPSANALLNPSVSGNGATSGLRRIATTEMLGKSKRC